MTTSAPFGEPSRTLPVAVDARRPGDLRMFAERVGALIDNPMAWVRITPEAATASPRAVTLQVCDRAGADFPGRWVLLVMVGTADYAHGGTQTVTVTGGDAVELVADRAHLVTTDADGSAQIEVDAAAGTRHVTAAVLGRAIASGAVTIT